MPFLDALWALPWEGWSALANWGTFLSGSVIAAVAARAAWLQFYGAVQIEIVDSVPVPGLIDQRLITVSINNRTPFAISLVWWAVRSRTWAMVAYPPSAPLTLGNDLKQVDARIEPKQHLHWTFAYACREGLAPFSLDLYWSRNGRFGRLHKTKTSGRPD